tara:strand:- start:1278 stop:1424 length:147 start_codon:yes stop_codon:yes gene_type:complete
MNSAALKFIPKEELIGEKYGKHMWSLNRKESQIFLKTVFQIEINEILS